MGGLTSSGAQDGARNADNIPPAYAPSFASRSDLLLAHPHVIPKRPGAPIGARDVHADTCRGLLVGERGGDLGRVRGEDAQRGSGAAHETRGKTAAAVGREHAERKNMHLDGGQWGPARGQVGSEDVQGGCYAGDGLV